MKLMKQSITLVFLFLFIISFSQSINQVSINDLNTIRESIVKGEISEAIKRSDKLIAKYPNDPYIIFLNGLALESIGNIQEAKLKYNKAIELYPYFYDALYNLGAIHYNSAIDSMNNESNSIYVQKELQLSKSYLEKILQINKDTIVKQYLYNIYNFSNQSTRKVDSLFNSPIIIKNKLDQIYIDKIEELLFERRKKEANKLIDLLLFDYFTNSDLNYLKAKTLIYLKETDRVEEYLLKSIYYDSLNYNAIYKLGNLYYERFISQFNKVETDNIEYKYAFKSQEYLEKYVYTIYDEMVFQNLDRIYTITNQDTINLYNLKAPYLYPSKKDQKPDIDEMPIFPGGEDELYKFLSNNIRYPESARLREIRGKVFVSFVVDKDGSIKNIKIHKGLKGGCNQEVVRVIRMMPKWKPGLSIKGEPIDLQFRIPINF
jgi:TonB family protein